MKILILLLTFYGIALPECQKFTSPRPGVRVIQPQTTDCSHDEQTIAYWDNLRYLPCRISQLDGTEFTVTTKDKFTLTTRTFHTTDATKYFLGPKTVSREDFIKSHSGIWIVSYCVHCRQVFGLVKPED